MLEILSEADREMNIGELMAATDFDEELIRTCIIELKFAGLIETREEPFQ